MLLGIRGQARALSGELPHDCRRRATYNSLHAAPGVLNALRDKHEVRCQASASMKEGVYGQTDQGSGSP